MSMLQRVLVVLGVCLPVPVFAATGLAIPLPASVERLAVALVPWADAATLQANETLMRGARGLIVLERSELAALPGALVLTPGEQSEGGSGHHAGRPHSSAADEPDGRSDGGGSRGGGPSSSTPAAATDQHAGPGSTSGGGEPVRNSGESEAERAKDDGVPEPSPRDTTPPPPPPPPPDGGGTDPRRDPSPVEETVEKVGEAPKTIVDEVDETTDEVEEVLDPVVDPVVAPVKDVVDNTAPGVLPRIGK